MGKILKLMLLILLAVCVAGTIGCRKKRKPPTGVPPGEGEEIEIPEVGAPPVEIFKEDPDEFIYQEIHFDFDRSEIKPRDYPILEKIAENLRNNRDKILLVEGHCDERGTNEYNMALGGRRALSTKTFLIKLGVESDRVFTVSYGEEDPLDLRHSEEAWTKNRRAHFKTAERE